MSSNLDQMTTDRSQSPTMPRTRFIFIFVLSSILGLTALYHYVGRQVQGSHLEDWSSSLPDLASDGPSGYPSVDTLAPP